LASVDTPRRSSADTRRLSRDSTRPPPGFDNEHVRNDEGGESAVSPPPHKNNRRDSGKHDAREGSDTVRETEDINIANSSSAMSSDLLAEMERLQKEVDALRQQYTRTNS